MARADPLVSKCALVSVVFDAYGTCIGEVQDVRYATISDEPLVPGPRGKKKEYKLVRRTAASELRSAPQRDDSPG